MRNDRGFTLMEILAVLLVIAVIASFAMPLIKSVRREMRYQQAKAAGVQLAEAVRSFYTDTKGCLAISNASEKGLYAPTAAETTACPGQHPITTGERGSSTDDNCGNNGGLYESIVFACNYISPKMFVSLPYYFKVLDPRADGEIFIEAKEDVLDEEGPRSFVIYRDMTVKETED